MEGEVQAEPTDYAAFVLGILGSMTRQSQSLDQSILRQCLGLASSYLVTDGTMNTERGITTWSVGFTRLVDVMLALHARNELEFETVNAASRACSECWTVTGVWSGLEAGQDGVRNVAAKLRKLLDEGGTTYRGEKVYAP